MGLKQKKVQKKFGILSAQAQYFYWSILMTSSPFPKDNHPATPSYRTEHNVTHPVCLSPMMSSRCPRPMGTRLSTALMPVCMGSFTEVRGMMPGAFMPTRCLSFEAMGPCTAQVEKENDTKTTNFVWLTVLLPQETFVHSSVKHLFNKTDFVCMKMILAWREVVDLFFFFLLLHILRIYTS